MATIHHVETWHGVVSHRGPDLPQALRHVIPPSQLVTYSKSTPCKCQQALGTHGFLLIAELMDLSSWVAAAARFVSFQVVKTSSGPSLPHEFCSIRMGAGLFGLHLPGH